jgi:hypothetical protein
VFGGKPASKEDATAATDAASAAADTPVSECRGVAAPATAVIADFDMLGHRDGLRHWLDRRGDDMRGGRFQSRAALVDWRRRRQQGALEVTGEVGTASVSVRRHDVLSGRPPDAGPHGLLGKKTLTFQARGDGRRYMLMVISGPPWTPFRSCTTSSGPEWHEVRLELAKYAKRTGSECALSASAPWARGPVPLPDRRRARGVRSPRETDMRLKQLLQNSGSHPELDGRSHDRQRLVGGQCAPCPCVILFKPGVAVSCIRVIASAPFVHVIPCPPSVSLPLFVYLHL